MKHDDLDWPVLREHMVARQVEVRGVDDPAVLAALRTVERHRFVPEDLRAQAYDDRALSIGHGQTISQPFVVGFMTAALAVAPDDRVLEVGTGCGYQAAVLATLGAHVTSLERLPALAEPARERLAAFGVEVHVADGALGWPAGAPFDAILVAAAAPAIPPALLDQLALGGRLIAPIGGDSQELVRVRRTESGLRSEALLRVRFVPLVTHS